MILAALLTSFAAHATTIQDVVALASRPQATPESVIAALPAELLSNFTLMRESMSLQGASPQNPRVILYTNDGRFSLTFNGDPALPGYDRLEMYEFHDDTRRFEFREISFSSGASAKVSEPNPTSCRVCHSNDPKPNFENYATWAGTYGANDDIEKSAEFTAFKSALHGRYLSLKFGSYPESPYMGSHAHGSDPVRFAQRANLRLTIGVLQTMTLRNARLLEALPRSRTLFAMSVLLSCPAPAAATKLGFILPTGQKMTADQQLPLILDPIGVKAVDWNPAFRFVQGVCPTCKGAGNTPLLHYDFADGQPVSTTIDSLDVKMDQFIAAHMLEDLATPSNHFADAVKTVASFWEDYYRKVWPTPDPVSLAYARTADAFYTTYDFDAINGACPLIEKALDANF